MNQKIRILEGIRQGKIGGGESVLLSLMENIDRTRFEPMVLSFTEGPMVDELRKMKIETMVIPSEKPFDLTVWQKVQNLVSDRKIDIVHAHGTRAASNMYKAAKVCGKPFIYTCHGWSFHPDQNPLVRRIRILSEKFLTRKATLNICVSNANKNTGQRLFGSRFTPVVIQNSIDASKFDPQRSYADIRQELQIAADDILFCFIARFTLQKQPLVLIRAFAAAAQANPSLRLLMVGDGEEKTKAEALAGQLGLQQRIIMLPFRKDVPAILAASDVFVLPSLWEGLPIALLEAMSMGKAIIASKVDGTAEIIEHGKNGWLIETDRLMENLQDAILLLGADATKRHSLGEAAHQTIRDHYDAATMTRRNEEIYLQLFQGKV